jgi:hypothetical protein
VGSGGLLSYAGHRREHLTLREWRTYDVIAGNTCSLCFDANVLYCSFGITRGLSASSRLSGDWHFLLHLHKRGRERADQWLAAHFHSIGVESTVDPQAKYL